MPKQVWRASELSRPSASRLIYESENKEVRDDAKSTRHLPGDESMTKHGVSFTESRKFLEGSAQLQLRGGGEIKRARMSERIWLDNTSDSQRKRWNGTDTWQ